MSDLSHHEKEVRPWGEFERYTLNEPSTVKIITVYPTEAFSLQTHTKRTEFWHILKGAGTVTIGSEVTDAEVGDQFVITKGTAHRAVASAEGLQFLEISFGDFDEEDITRLEDRYGRS